MPSFNARTVEECFRIKLGAQITEGARHRQFDFFDDDGLLVASTVMSRGWKGSDSLSNRLIGDMQRDLHLRGRSQDFTRLIRCPLIRKEWLWIVEGAVETQPFCKHSNICDPIPVVRHARRPRPRVVYSTGAAALPLAVWLCRLKHPTSPGDRWRRPLSQRAR
jgi:hypothetical protein